MSDSAAFHAWVYDHLSRLFDGDVTEWPPRPADAPRDGAIRRAVDDVAHALTVVEPSGTQADHVRLFVNAMEGVAAPPYASWYRDGTLGGPTTSWVAATYLAQQIAIAAEAGEPPDYLPCELGFLHFLSRHEFAARQTGDRPALADALAARHRFITSHFAHFVPMFLARVRGAHAGPVFAAAAELLGRLLAEELRPQPKEQPGCHRTVE
jgi:TorA maturation chaperone TorD